MNKNKYMKNYRIGSVIAAGALLLGACSSDFEASGNGRLDGFWQMTNVDTLATGRSGDVADRMIFWSVQGKLIELSDHRLQLPSGESRYPSIFYCFERSADSLKLLGEPKPRKSSRLKGDREVASESECGAYGVNSEGDVLKILRLESNKMTLQSDYLRMYFKKY